VNTVRLSLHPAGHILGSSQVRIEAGDHVCVVSGDYKTDSDPTCAPMEPLRCHTFISESTFGLPIFKWPPPRKVLREINVWWRTNRDQGRTSILFAYALGKAQRILAGLDASIGPILTHGAVEKINRHYRQAGIALPATCAVGDLGDAQVPGGALVMAPPSADSAAWMRRFPKRSRALASGWMRIRGNRRRRSVDRGFVLSDHSDWDGLVRTIAATGAERIGITHGYADEMVRWLREGGQRAFGLAAAENSDAEGDGEGA
jgi:putative mRNA 3-end processing factor